MSAAILFTAILSLLEPARIDSILADTQGNEVFWRGYLSFAGGEALEAVHHLLGVIPRLDRLEMDETILSDHVFGALDSRQRFYDSLPDSVFLTGLVEYRISEEPVTAFRAPLESYWSSTLDEADTTVVSIAYAMAARLGSFEVRKPSFLGGVAGPLDVLTSGGGTPDEIRVLFGCSLRSLGIASRPGTGFFTGPGPGETGWMEVWDGDEWLPVPLASDSIPTGWANLAWAFAGNVERTAALTPTGTAVIEPVQMAPESTLAAISIAVPGYWLPIDYLEFSPTEPCTLVLGEGSYLLQLARRTPSASVMLWTELFDVRNGSISTISLPRLVEGAD